MKDDTKERLARYLEQIAPEFSVSIITAPDGTPLMVSFWCKEVIVSKITPGGLQ